MNVQTGSIVLPNSGGATNPSAFTLGSYISINTPDGPNTVTVDISESWAQSGGLLIYYQTTQSPGITAPVVRVYPQSYIVADSNGNTSGLVSGANDKFTFGLNGACTVWVIAGSGALTGAPTVSLRSGPGVPAFPQASLAGIYGNDIAGVFAPSGTAAGSYATGAHTITSGLPSNWTNAACWVKIYDAGSGGPSAAQVPIVQIPVGFGLSTAPTGGYISFAPSPRVVAVGIYITFESAPGNYSSGANVLTGITAGTLTFACGGI